MAACSDKNSFCRETSRIQARLRKARGGATNTGDEVQVRHQGADESAQNNVESGEGAVGLLALL